MEVVAVAGEGVIVVAGLALVVGPITPHQPQQSKTLDSSPHLVGSRVVAFV